MPLLGLKKTIPTIPPLPLISNSLHQRLQITLTEKGILIKPFDLTTSTATTNDNLLCKWNGQLESIEGVGLERADDLSIVVYGIGGLLKGFRNHFLILITKVERVSDNFDPSTPIYSIKSTIAIPLEFLSAKLALESYVKTSPNTEASKLSGAEGTDGEGEDDEETETETEEEILPEADDESTISPVALPSPSKSIKDTVKVANKPFNFKRFNFNLPPLSALSKLKSTPISPSPSTPIAIPPPAVPLIEEEEEDQEIILSRSLLDKKVVRECQGEMIGLYFSFTSDITHSLQHQAHQSKQSKEKLNGKNGEKLPTNKKESAIAPLINLPLHSRADKRFWWNSHLISPFVNAGFNAYVIVLQQGFIRQSSVSLPLQSYNVESLSSRSELEQDVEPTSITLDFLLISRRSIERPGLRYMRRGINSGGDVANFVESEFLVRCMRDGKVHIGSFVQTRGSIPIYWTQSPWALKPIPIVDKEREEEGKTALALHFDKQVKLYGKQIIVNLAETKGKEAAVVAAYGKGVEDLGRGEAIKYVEFDFHQECKGMKYENISKLINQLKNDLENLEYFWTGEQVYSTQTGVVRTNCIDCLDRTNVVQSALSRFFLNRHLVHLGITTQEEAGLHDNLDREFNALWAENGDAISREYAGTNALKGDFTRTGKRNIYGLMNDASNSVARLVQSTTSDFFKQAVIDYILGVNLGAFVEFQEKLDISDPSEIIRLSQIREEAIETCAKLVLENEIKIGGWTLLSPIEQDVIRSTAFLERVLLISDKAVYVVVYDFSLQKVSAFTRIPTGDIVKIQQGPYILSPVEEGRDPNENYGFIIKYHSTEAIERVHTYSMRVKVSSSPSKKNTSLNSSGSIEFDTRFFAFKALRKDAIKLSTDGKSQVIDRSSILDRNGKEGKTAKDVVKDIIEVLRDECEKFGAVEKDDENWVENKAIISLSEAIAHTTYSDKFSQGLKSLSALIWL